jgi:hypothetical protein
MGPCHHGRARRQVADRGIDKYVRRVAANIVDKQSHIDKTRWYSKSEFGRGNNSSSRKRAVCYEMLHRVSFLDIYFGRI